MHKAELEDQKQDSFYPSRHHRGNSRRHHPHSGSLQDLVDSVSNELDGDYMGSQARRHPQHSRYAKNSSSNVSSRQREGGSLPNNVNSSSCYPHISPFSLSKYPKSNSKNSNKIKADPHDYERNSTNHHRNTVISESVNVCEETQPSIPSTSALVSSAIEKTHTVINIEDLEETRHLLAHDSLAQVSFHCVQASDLKFIEKIFVTFRIVTSV